MQRTFGGRKLIEIGCAIGYTGRKEVKMNKKIFQKLIGVAMTGIGVLPFIVGGDATASLLLIPLGLYMVFSKTLVICY